MRFLILLIIMITIQEKWLLPECRLNTRYGILLFLCLFINSSVETQNSLPRYLGTRRRQGMAQV